MAKQIFDFVSASAEFHTDFKYQVDSKLLSESALFTHYRWDYCRKLNPWQISKRVFQENKACQIFWRTNISYSLIRTRTFFRKFGVLCFLQTPVLRFALLPYYRRNWSQAFREGFLEKTLYFFIWFSPLGIYFFFFKSLKPI